MWRAELDTARPAWQGHPHVQSQLPAKTGGLITASYPLSNQHGPRSRERERASQILCVGNYHYYRVYVVIKLGSVVARPESLRGYPPDGPSVCPRRHRITLRQFPLV